MTFTMLALLKNGSSWNTIARVVELTELTFKQMMTNFVSIVWSHIHESPVDGLEKDWTMLKLCSVGRAFSNFPLPDKLSVLHLKEKIVLSGTCRKETLYKHVNKNYTDVKFQFLCFSTNWSYFVHRAFHDRSRIYLLLLKEMVV